MAVELTRKNRWWFWPLALALAPVALLLGAVQKITGSGKADLTPNQAASYIRDFISGAGGAWDWDDFTSVPIRDPILECIRQEAEMVQLPATDEGFAKLRGLLARAEAMARP